MYGVRHITADSFELVNGDELITIRFDQIEEVTAYKYDLFSYDEICIAIRMGADEWYEISEQTYGYTAWVPALEKSLRIRADWWSKVAFPAFEKCWTQLYKRGESPP